MCPGEQPQGGGFIKLNTNENPYPPSPRVKSALVEAVNDRLRLYPDPLSTAFRQTVAQLHGVSPDMVLAGNGSDDLLTILTRAFVGPGDLAAFPSPSYLLYSTLVALQDGRSVVVPYQSDWSLDWNAAAFEGVKVFWLANPDSPSGTAMTREQIARLAGGLDCPLVVDEAYADFAEPAAPCDSADRRPRQCDRHSLVQQRIWPGRDSPGLPGRSPGARGASDQVKGLVQLRHAQPGRRGRGPVRPGLPRRDAVQDHRDPQPADERAAGDGLHGSREPIQFRVGDRWPAGPRDFPETQGSQDPGSADDLSRVSRRA